jgi:tetratricopeptide (TPR) repeat protein
MFRFEHPYYLYLLIALPILALVYVWYWWRKSSAIKKMGDAELIKQLMPQYRPIKGFVKFMLMWLALASLIIAIANPQMGSKIEKVKRKGVDVFIALDVSKSMMAEDVKPNRLTRAKQAVKTLIDNLENDRIGLIIFAGRSYLQMPLTVDYGAASMYLNSANCDMVPTQGTAIGAAIDQATESYQTKDKKHKALIIISDGENHEDDAIEAAQAAANEGVQIFTVGIGSTQGAPIPSYSGGVQTDFKKDENGSIVLSKLNEEALKEVAKAGNGSYLQLTNSQDEVRELIKKISTMEQKTMEERMFADYVDYFQYFLALALIFMLLEVLVFEKPTKWLGYLKQLIPVLLIAFSFSSANAQATFFNPKPERKAAREALDFYKHKKYLLADSFNKKAIGINKNFGEAYYNKGNTNYEKDSFRLAAEDFKNAASLLQNPTEKARALHNMGNSYLKQRNYNEAIEAYKNALKTNPNDRDTKYNLEYAKAMLKNNPPKNNDKNDKKNDKDKKDQNKKDGDKKQEKNKGNDKQKQQQNNKDDKKKDNQGKDGDGKKGEKDKQGQQPKPGKISKEQADRMLKNLRAEEQKTKQNADKKNTLVTKSKSVDKDW